MTLRIECIEYFNGTKKYQIQEKTFMPALTAPPGGIIPNSYWKVIKDYDSLYDAKRYFDYLKGGQVKTRTVIDCTD